MSYRHFAILWSLVALLQAGCAIYTEADIDRMILHSQTSQTYSSEMDEAKDRGDYARALQVATNARAYFRASKAPDYEAHFLFLAGHLFDFGGQARLDEAVKYYNEGIRILAPIMHKDEDLERNYLLLLGSKASAEYYLGNPTVAAETIRLIDAACGSRKCDSSGLLDYRAKLQKIVSDPQARSEAIKLAAAIRDDQDKKIAAAASARPAALPPQVATAQARPAAAPLPSPQQNSNECRTSLGFLGSRIPTLTAAELQTQRSNVLAESVTGAMAKAKQQGFTADSAMKATLAQAREFDRVSRESAQCAADVDAMGATDEQFLAWMRQGQAPSNCRAGIRAACICAGIINRIAAVGTRALAAEMQCHIRAGTWATASPSAQNSSIAKQPETPRNESACPPGWVNTTPFARTPTCQDWGDPFGNPNRR